MSIPTRRSTRRAAADMQLRLDITGSADISECGRYRWSLTRCWTLAELGRTNRICWVMLNPSTADGEQDDATIRRCIDFSDSWGYGELVVVNLFAWRATKPAELRRVIRKQGLVTATGGARNTRALRQAIASSALTVAAWGASGGMAAEERAAWLARDCMLGGFRLMCLGTTQDGTPRHPVRLPKSQKLERWT